MYKTRLSLIESSHRPANASIRGVRDALKGIDKEGGICLKETIRTPNEQGLRVRLKYKKTFQNIDLKGGGKQPRADGPPLINYSYRQTVCVCMYIRIINIHTVLPGARLTGSEVEELLRLLPVAWEIRESTLTSIIHAFPNMTTLQFRRSLYDLVLSKPEVVIKRFKIIMLGYGQRLRRTAVRLLLREGLKPK